MNKKYLCCTDKAKSCNESCRFYRFIHCLITAMKKRNYCLTTISCYVRCIEHYFRWLLNSPDKDIDENSAKYFIKKHLPECSCWYRAPISVNSVRAALNWLLKALREAKEIISPVLRKTPIDNELEKYKSYLDKICGFSQNTVIYRLRYVKEFLEKVHLQNAELTPYSVIDYVSSRVRNCNSGTAKVITASLRNYFKYLSLNNSNMNELYKVVPTVPQWKLSSIPVILSDTEVNKVLQSFDQSTVPGKRDYAIALCYSGLGLRTCEIAALTIDNINWRSGLLTIPDPKHHSERVIPLLNSVGEAIADYLLYSRPVADSRILFLRLRGAKGSPASCDIIRGVLRRAFERCNIKLPLNTGPHVFRHTLASKLLQQGNDIKEIADVLGHKSIETTMIYTKIDLPMLSKVAMKWPEVLK